MEFVKLRGQFLDSFSIAYSAVACWNLYQNVIHDVSSRNSGPGSAYIVSKLTQACVLHPPRESFFRESPNLCVFCHWTTFPTRAINSYFFYYGNWNYDIVSGKYRGAREFRYTWASRNYSFDILQAYNTESTGLNILVLVSWILMFSLTGNPLSVGSTYCKRINIFTVLPTLERISSYMRWI